MSKEALQYLLNKFETSTELDENEIYPALKDLEKDSKEMNNSLSAEILAFAFLEDFNWSKWPNGGWNTTFGPVFVWNNGDGTANIYPSRDQITKATIQYWENRMNSTTNDIFKARYAGLLWDFYKYVCKENPKIDYAYKKIDSIIKIVELGLYNHKTNIISKLKQALKLAIEIGDKQHINKVKDIILQYETDVIKEPQISYNYLLNNKKVELSATEEDGIISRIEERLDKLVYFLPNTPIGVDAIKEASIYLAEYYGKRNQIDKQTLALNKYADSVIQQSRVGSPLQAQVWLSKAYEIMRKFNKKNNVEKIALELQAVNSRLSDDMHTISVSMEIPQKEIDQHIEKMTNGDLETCLRRITFYFIPKRINTEEQVKELAKNYPMRYLCKNVLADYKGRQVAVIGPLSEDLEGHTIAQMHQNIQLEQGFGFMHTIISNILNKHKVTVNDLKQYFNRSHLFHLADTKILEYSLSAYLARDPIGFLHTVIPQIENMLRGLVEQNIQPIVKGRRGGGFQLITFDEVLRSDIISKTFGQDISFYLRVVFTDQRGLNLRNDICHGIARFNELSMKSADVVFHVLLILASCNIA